MTFTEAAVEVLRLVGKPLHYKKITEVAIERSLLSHVGKTPEVTMSSRLATMVKRDRGDAPIIKVKPGVFGLRDFSVEQLSDLSGDVDELPEVEVESEQNKTDDTEAASADAPKPRVEAKRPLPGADVFPEEADDDEPILGSPEEEDDDEEDEESSAEAGGESGAGESRSARRRRKRRRRGGEEAEEPRPPREPQRAAAPEVRENPGRGRGGNDRDRNSRDRTAQSRDRNDRERDRNERERDRGERDRGERDRGERDRGERDRNDRERDRNDRERDRNDRERDRGERDRDVAGDFNREAADGDLLGKDLADAVASVLSQSSPRGLSALRVAEMLVRRGRLQGDPQLLVPTVMAAVRADVARSHVERARPRFRVESGAVVLTDLLLPQDVVRAEQDVVRAAERQRDRARRAFLRRVSDLPGAGLAELVATWLNGEGVVGLRAVRRPMAAPGDLHLAGTLRRGVEEVRLAIIVCRDGRELGRERVVEARGALHYYGGATSAWVITLGNVMSGAREEAQAPATAPVSLYDGMALAAAMERVGVGLVTQHVAISSLDFELLDALRGPSRERDDRDERGRDERGRDERGRDERGRDERNERSRDRDDRRRERDDRRNDRGREREDNIAARDEGNDFEQEARSDAEDVGEDAGTAQPNARTAETTGAVRGQQPAAPGEGRRRKRRRRRKGRGEGREADAPQGVAVDGADEDAEEAYAEGDEERDDLDAERPQEEADFEGEGPYADEDRSVDQGDDLTAEEDAESAADDYLDEPYEEREADEAEADEDPDDAELEEADLEERDADDLEGDRVTGDDDRDDDERR
jgi:hypothetical protein